jgi:hypothetical protein
MRGWQKISLGMGIGNEYLKGGQKHADWRPKIFLTLLKTIIPVQVSGRSQRQEKHGQEVAAAASSLRVRSSYQSA